MNCPECGTPVRGPTCPNCGWRDSIRPLEHTHVIEYGGPPKLLTYGWATCAVCHEDFELSQEQIDEVMGRP